MTMHKISSTYRFIAFLLASLVFFTSSGFVLGKHQCKLKEQNKELTCAETGCQKGCCSTDFQYFKLDQDQQTTTLNFDINSELIQFLTAYLVVFFIDEFFETATLTDDDYKPPLISKDIPVLFESFLL